MNEQELRALVRESIAKQLGESRVPAATAHRGPEMVDSRLHASHGVYAIARLDAPDGDGPCIIEPAVPCTHCDYCKSHGH